jgi:beta-phosphoglucomutase family hydrolase
MNAPIAVIFDMDGTLVATTELDFLAWQKLFSEYNVHITFEQYFPLLGMKSADMVKHFLKLEGDNAAGALFTKMQYFDELVDLKGIELFANTELLLSHLQSNNIPLALATSSRQRKMRRIMNDTGLAYFFQTIVTGEEIVHGKPAPDIFLLAAKRLSIEPSSCIVVEDAINGVIAAKAAGMKCIAVTNTHPHHDLSMADLIIDDLSQLLTIDLQSFFA